MFSSGTRDPSGGQTAAHQYPIARSFAVVVLFALAALVLLRHLFGSIRLEVGAR